MAAGVLETIGSTPVVRSIASSSRARPLVDSGRPDYLGGDLYS